MWQHVLSICVCGKTSIHRSHHIRLTQTLASASCIASVLARQLTGHDCTDLCTVIQHVSLCRQSVWYKKQHACLLDTHVLTHFFTRSLSLIPRLHSPPWAPADYSASSSRASSRARTTILTATPVVKMKLMAEKVNALEWWVLRYLTAHHKGRQPQESIHQDG
jgi:hypothetical protein